MPTTLSIGTGLWTGGGMGATIGTVGVGGAAGVGSMGGVTATSEAGESVLEAVLSSLPPIRTKSTQSVIMPFARQVARTMHTIVSFHHDSNYSNHANN